MFGNHLKQMSEALQLANTLSEALLHMTSQHHEEFLELQKCFYQQNEDWIAWCKQTKEEEMRRAQENEEQRLEAAREISREFNERSIQAYVARITRQAIAEPPPVFNVAEVEEDSK